MSSGFMASFVWPINNKLYKYSIMSEQTLCFLYESTHQLIVKYFIFLSKLNFKFFSGMFSKYIVDNKVQEYPAKLSVAS
jgi:hypothetical protein